MVLGLWVRRPGRAARQFAAGERPWAMLTSGRATNCPSSGTLTEKVPP